MDLISEVVGGRIVACNDEFFAEASNLLQVGEPVWREGVYTDRGKWMDGWETRRRREPGHDWCLIALGLPGRIREVTVDTSYFTGNFPEAFSVEACGPGAEGSLEDAVWVEIVPRTPLSGDTVAAFPVNDPHRVTHLRLNILPDGGIARLRVDGDPIPAMEAVCPQEGPADLVSALVGGLALEASDVHYSPPSNLLRPTDPAGMWDGWETRRRRGAGNDWATFRFGLPGVVERVVVDTRHFKGNAPGWVSIHLADEEGSWWEVASRAEVEADRVNDLVLGQPAHATRLRLDIHPDGGVARLRVLGRPDTGPAAAVRLLYLNSLFDAEARTFFHTACASTFWVDRMNHSRPFASPEEVLGAADDVFDTLEEADWLDAFAGHPRIGERGDETANREQGGTADADAEMLAALAGANRAYEEAHGFTYIVYATGKKAEEMLEIARRRLHNSRVEEIAIAAGEQRVITRTRLRRMLCMGDST